MTVLFGLPRSAFRSRHALLFENLALRRSRRDVSLLRLDWKGSHVRPIATAEPAPARLIERAGRDRQLDLLGVSRRSPRAATKSVAAIASSQACCSETNVT